MSNHTQAELQDAAHQLDVILDILTTAKTRTMAIDQLYRLYPELDNTNVTRRRRE